MRMRHNRSSASSILRMTRLVFQADEKIAAIVEESIGLREDLSRTKASLEAIERQLCDVNSERTEAMQMLKDKDKQVELVALVLINSCLDQGWANFLARGGRICKLNLFAGHTIVISKKKKGLHFNLPRIS